MTLIETQNKELIEELKKRVKGGVIEAISECGQLCDTVFFLKDKKTNFQLEITDLYDECQCSRCKKFLYD
jgi:hypothetical protein